MIEVRNGWLIEDPIADDFYDGILATHLLSGAQLTWIQPKPGCSVWPAQDDRVQFIHPALPQRALSGSLQRVAAKIFILDVCGALV